MPIPHYIEKVSVSAIIPLRHEILRPGRDIATAEFDGDHDEDTYHLALFTQGHSGPVCCVSYMLKSRNEKESYQLRGMATHANFQKKGLGKLLAEYGEKLIISDTHIKSFWCNARKESVGFYEKLGWKVDSSEFEIKDVGPHYEMIKNL